MKSRFVFSLYLVFTVVSVFSQSVRIRGPESDSDKRDDDIRKIIEMAVSATEEDWGPLDFRVTQSSMNRARELEELERGVLIDLSWRAWDADWDKRTLRVPIPLRGGLLGYRLFLIRRESQSRFSEVGSLEDLSSLVGGLGRRWMDVLVFREAGLEILEFEGYEKLFILLELGRFDYFPRGVNEIYSEFDAKIPRFSEMQVENHIALLYPLPVYLYVTPEKPELALRLKEGLQYLVDSGELQDFLLNYHADSLDRADLSGRRIFSMKNPHLTPEVSREFEQYRIRFENK